MRVKLKHEVWDYGLNGAMLYPKGSVFKATRGWLFGKWSLRFIMSPTTIRLSSEQQRFTLDNDKFVYLCKEV